MGEGREMMMKPKSMIWFHDSGTETPAHSSITKLEFLSSWSPKFCLMVHVRFCCRRVQGTYRKHLLSANVRTSPNTRQIQIRKVYFPFNSFASPVQYLWKSSAWGCADETGAFDVMLMPYARWDLLVSSQALHPKSKMSVSSFLSSPQL